MCAYFLNPINFKFFEVKIIIINFGVKRIFFFKYVLDLYFFNFKSIILRQNSLKSLLKDSFM